RAELSQAACNLCGDLDGRLMVTCYPGWLARVPWAPSWPYELLIFPERHVADLPTAGPDCAPGWRRSWWIASAGSNGYSGLLSPPVGGSPGGPPPAGTAPPRPFPCPWRRCCAALGGSAPLPAPSSVPGCSSTGWPRQRLRRS